MRDRLVAWLAAGAILALAGCSHGQGSQGNGHCQDLDVNMGAMTVRVLFAKNGAVQRFVFPPGNYEDEHEMLLTLEKQYGPAEINAPPLNVISFKKGTSNGLQIPDKAIDSCGRTLSFAQ